MLLVQDGKISLGDPISKYYATSPTSWKDVTIQHLLTHGSGIQDYWVHRPEALSDNKIFLSLFRSYRDFIRLVSDDPLAFEPGTNMEYSNAGYALLTFVIERVSGTELRRLSAQPHLHARSNA